MIGEAVALHRNGQLAQAERLYLSVLEADPRNFGALNLLAILLQQRGCSAEAITLFERAVEVQPDNPDTLYNLALCHARLKRHDSAVACYRRAIAARPSFAEAHCNLGVALRELGRPDDAIASYRRAVELKPNYAEAYFNLGNALCELNRFDEAVASYRAAIEFRPAFAGAHVNLGNALRGLRHVDAAVASYRRAIEQNPADAVAYNNMGIALLQLSNPADGMPAFRRAVELKPDYAEAYHNLGTALRELKRYDEARASYAKALAIEPDLRYGISGLASSELGICRWDDFETRAEELVTQIADHKLVDPFACIAFGLGSLDVLKAAQSRFRFTPLPASKAIRHRARERSGRIKLAYLSADFGRHPVGYVIAELLERHDRSRFEVIGISLGRDDGSDERARIVKALDQFHDVRARTDSEVASLLGDLEADIAIDLMGHTNDARFAILSRRAAPVQVTYLGYPGTTGTDFIDYLIADAAVAPFEEQPCYTEKIVHLPNCYLVGDSAAGVVPSHIPTRREAGLPDQGFVFCGFSPPYKITPPLFDRWMRLLGAVETSVLWLSPAHELAVTNLRREAAARGVDPNRLIFAAKMDRLEDHLARLRQADLFLDTIPYNAHTTAAHALWVGLPVVTCAGGTFAGRVGTSLVRAAGLPELATHRLEDYEALAMKLATDPSRLRSVRTKLEGNRAACPLFDTDLFRRHIESAYMTMWRLWQRGEGPRGFSVDTEMPT